MKVKLLFISLLIFTVSSQWSGSTDYHARSYFLSTGGVNSSQDSASKGTFSFNSSRINGVIYTRVPRTVSSDLTINQFTRERTTVEGTSYTNFDIYDRLSETGDDRASLQVFNGPGQLIFLDSDGDSHVLFDCMTAPTPCVPLDAMVDYAGDKVLFSVYYGELKPLNKHNQDLPNQLLHTTYAQMHIVDLHTFEVTPIAQPENVYDTGPVWLPDGRIMFTSTRDKEFGTSVRELSPLDTHVLQLWISDVDGRNARNVSPHERDHALHPYVLSSGRIIYSTWQMNHQLPFRDNNGEPNLFGTTRNFFWVASIDLRGGDFHSLLGAHSIHVKNDPLEDIQAAHFLGERANGDICASNYYHANNLGAGTILCWPPEPLGVEGWGPAEVPGVGYRFGESMVFSPRNLYSALSFATSADRASNQDEETGEYLGKVRDPDGLPDGNLLLSYGRGRCSESHDLIFDVQKDDVVCDFGIYATNASNSMASGPLAEHPSELLLIVDEPEWHEYMPRVVAPYAKIYGIDKPEQPELSNSGHQDVCLLGSKSMQMHGVGGGAKPHLSEIENFNGWSFGDREICGRQGCSMHGIDPASEITAIRFWRVHPLKLPEGQTPGFNEVQSIIGSRVEILGDVSLENDGSFLVQLPCDMPYVMAGIDKDGRAIARDQVVQSLRPGEKRICEGCHLHSKLLDFEFDKTIAAQKKATILREKEARELEYNRDIIAIFDQWCVSCHNSNSAEGGLALDVPGKDEGSSYHTLVWNHDPFLERPETSRYVNGSFARESLLYWKAAGTRTDGRDDSDYNDDIDFGPAHSTDISQHDLNILGDWLDSGAYFE